MKGHRAHDEPHLSDRRGWLRAAVMGANDGILSVSALLVGVASSGAGAHEILLAGLAGTVAGAMSMAAGEYVSVSSQADAEASDIEKEKSELARNPDGELAELVAIYRERGLSAELAQQVAWELTAKDALGTHLRDEIGITDLAPPRPVEAALVSAATFAAGAAIPMLAAWLSPPGVVITIVVVATLLALGGLGALGASAGGASTARGAARVVLWGVFAMAATALIGALVGQVV